MPPSNCGVYQLLSISSVCESLCLECASIHSRVWFLPHPQQANTHIIHYSYRHTWEGCSRLSVKCTPPNLVSISSSPSNLSAKHCSMSVHGSIQEFDFCRILSRLIIISNNRGIILRTVVGDPSNAHPQLWRLSGPLHHLYLLNLVPWVYIDAFNSLSFTAY